LVMSLRNNTAETPGGEKLSMNLVIVGGGKACKSLLQLLCTDPPPYLDIKILGVCDLNPQAEGFQLAKDMGIFTTTEFRDLFRFKDLDAILELAGNREVLLDLIRDRPKGIGVLDHNISRILHYVYSSDRRLKLAQEQVTLEKAMADLLIQQSDARIVVLTPGFTIAEANEPYLSAVGKPKDEVIGAHCHELTHGLNAPCSVSQPELGCPLLETLKTGKSAHVLHEHLVPHGQSTYCDLVTYPLKDRSGRIVRIIEIWRDITREIASRWENREKNLKADLQKLIQEDRMISLGKLVASSVHEINNPIQGLLTFSRLMENTLAEGKPTKRSLQEFKDHLSLMSSELERIGKIVSGLLSFARQSEPGWNYLDVNELLDQVVHLTHHKMDIQNIHLESRFTDARLMIHGDLHQLQQCFLNLVFNAIEAMPNGGLLSVTSALDDSSGTVSVEIRDTGCGIRPEHLDHIFDPFFTTKEAGKGTGLGLSIVHGIVKAHHGDIQVESRLGEGTAFVLFFPPAQEGELP
jgi:two-component system NtrC family sensor kinase